MPYPRDITLVRLAAFGLDRSEDTVPDGIPILSGGRGLYDDVLRSGGIERMQGVVETGSVGFGVEGERDGHANWWGRGCGSIVETEDRDGTAHGRQSRF